MSASESKPDEKTEEKDAKGERALTILRDPDTSASLATLTSLDLRGSGLAELPESVSYCTGLQRLDVGDNKLRDLPDALADLSNLGILFASNAGFAELPPVLARCTNLKMLGVKDNNFTVLHGDRLPEGLVWLIAASNNIEELPNIGRCQRIRKLMLSHNRLTCDSLAPVASIADLEMIRVAANRLEAFPPELLRHPRLAWVAVGGNPFSEAIMERELACVPPTIDFSEVTLAGQLGSGAGATVYSALWQGRDVAAKIWQAERFSDGTSLGEWGVNRVIGQPGHESLIGVLGAFEHPKAGMILELLEGAVAAASPPNFATVTRDALPDQGGRGPRYSASGALGVAQAVASACEYLWHRGVLHGDVYLHNTLVVLGNASGGGCDVRDVRLSDFGAAAVVDDPRFEKLEVRSFGWLLQDLLESLQPPAHECTDAAAAIVSRLQGLRDQCQQESPEDLPTFAALAAALKEV